MGHTGLNVVRARIAEAARKAGRSDPIELVVVTKYADDAAVAAVIADGARILGESRARQMAERSARFATTEWHFIGRLQRNKVNLVRPCAAVLHSMDRVALCDAWRDPAGSPPVLIQVNLAQEPQKGGVAAAEAQGLVEYCARSGVEVRGLMTVPPRSEVPGDSASWFAELRRLRDRLRLDHPSVVELSMGMTDDFECAVAEGATILRVGRAIFDASDDKG